MSIQEKLRFKNAFKPFITSLSMLMLFCSTLSYAGYDKTKESVPVFYWLGNEREAIAFDQAILQNSHYFATNLALRAYAKNLYHALHDVKQHHFQRQQIALMEDVLAELKAINKNLSDRLSIPKPEEPHQKFKRLSDEINKFQISDSGDVVSLVGDVKFNIKNTKEALCEMYLKASKTKTNSSEKVANVLPTSMITKEYEIDQLLKIYAPSISELKSKFEEIAKHWNVIDSNSDQASQLPVGSIEENKQTALAKIADYHMEQLEKTNIMLAKNSITDFTMNKPTSKAMDNYYIDPADGLKKPKIIPPDIKSSNCGFAANFQMYEQ